MIKTKTPKRLIFLLDYTILLISIFFVSSCINQPVDNKLIKTHPDETSQTQAEDTVVIIPNIESVTNVATGNNSTANMGSVNLKDFTVKGNIINKSNVNKAANVAIDQGSNASMGSVSVKTPYTPISVNIDVKVDKTAIAKSGGTGVSNQQKATTNSVKAETYKDYKVELAASERITIPGIPGQLRVWIGIPKYQPNFSPEMTRATGSLPAVGTTAKVTPVAPAFKVEPIESDCMIIHPTGSEVGFKLIPIEEGTFSVGADVQLYDSKDCRGTPIPKATSYLQVQVVVDHAKELQKHTKEFKEVFWDKLLEFWGGILAVFFALLLFLLRRHLKKWFGFEDK